MWPQHHAQGGWELEAQAVGVHWDVALTVTQGGSSGFAPI